MKSSIHQLELPNLNSKVPKGSPIQPATAKGIGGTVKVFPEFAERLKDIEDFSHIILVFHFHLAKRSPGDRFEYLIQYRV